MLLSNPLLLAFLTITIQTTTALDAANSRYCCYGREKLTDESDTFFCCDYMRYILVGGDKPTDGQVNGKYACGMHIWGNAIDYQFNKCCATFEHGRGGGVRGMFPPRACIPWGRDGTWDAWMLVWGRRFHPCLLRCQQPVAIPRGLAWGSRQINLPFTVNPIRVNTNAFPDSPVTKDITWASNNREVHHSDQ